MRTLCLFLLAALASTGMAQPDLSPRVSDGSVWETFAGTQYATLLLSENTEIRTIALDQVLFVASRWPGVDLTAATESLLAIYERDDCKQHRIASAVALRAIGDRASLERLATLSQREDTPAVRRTTLAALVSYAASLSDREAARLNYYVD